jgi:CRISPR/Cas system CSM-associated protein Csm3 (group 7 of RAMP superfamily)
MQNVVLRWEFLSFWQSSSGKGEHTRLDALTARDPQGLPVLPGRTIKGLFREAAQQLVLWGQLDQEQVISLFGKPDDAKSSAGTGNGLLVFDSAFVSRELAAAYAKQEITREMIYRDIAQTAIDRETGSARDHSLRRIEVVVPLTLYSNVSLLATNGPALDAALLGKIAREVRYAGSLRKRGLGRVEVKLETKP